MHLPDVVRHLHGKPATGGGGDDGARRGRAGWVVPVVGLITVWRGVEPDAQPDFHVPAGDLDFFDDQPDQFLPLGGVELVDDGADARGEVLDAVAELVAAGEVSALGAWWRRSGSGPTGKAGSQPFSGGSGGWTTGAGSRDTRWPRCWTRSLPR